MYKHPVSAFVRLLPALSWLVACVVAVWMPVRLALYLQAEGHWKYMSKAWPTAIVLLVFVAIAIYALREMRKEFRNALPALRADTPIRIGLPIRSRPRQTLTPMRYPLSDVFRSELQQLIETLQGAGMLQSGEVAFDEIVDCAESMDEWSEVDLYMAMNVLQALHAERKHSFANLAFFPADVETDESDALAIVQELGRLCGRSQELSAIRVRATDGGKIIPAHRGFPPPNAVAEFHLRTGHHAVPFVLYSKNLPGGLIEALATIFTDAADPRRFVWENFDSFFAVSYLTPSQLSLVNSAERAQVLRFAEVG